MTSVHSRHVSYRWKALVQIPPAPFLLAHSVACTIKRSFKKKVSQGNKNRTKSMASFDLGLSSAEENRKNGSLARYQNLKLLLRQQYHCWCYNSSGD